jgi:hypothetical protein
MVDRTVTAAEVFSTYAPPAFCFLHPWQHQIPTAVRFMAYFPQKSQKNLECWDTSCFFTTLRSDAPYRVPYLPTMPVG